MGEKIYDLVIVGGGPAGLTASIYASRAGLDALVIEQGVFGGQAILTDKIENYPGFPEGVSGVVLMSNFEKQAKNFDMQKLNAKVNETELKGDIKILKTSKGDVKARSVILATGSSPRKLGIPGEDKLTGRGITYCATCDGAFFKDRKVFVVGGGDAALEEADFLTRYVNEAILVHRRNEFRATDILQKRAKENEKISFLTPHEIVEITGDNKVEKIHLKNTDTGEIIEEEAEGVFIFIGTEPNTKFINDEEILDNRKYVITDVNLNTKIPGVFAAGDIRANTLRQVSTAVGNGALAAVQAQHYLA